MRFLTIVYREVGLQHLVSSSSPRDLFILIASRFIRLLGFGAVAPILVIFLQEQLGFSKSRVGLFLSLTLFGDVTLSLLISWVADSFGRRRVLALGSVLMAISGIVFTVSSNYVVLLVSAILGVISPSGNECGPFSSIEVTMIADLVPPTDRVYVLAWYQIFGFIGLAFGSVLSGSIISKLELERTTLESYRAIFALYSVLAVIKIALCISLSSLSEGASAESKKTELCRDGGEVEPELAETAEDCERLPLLANANPKPPRARDDIKIPIRPKRDSTQESSDCPLGRLGFTCLLFSIDSFASSLIPASYVSLYLKSVFVASIATITKVLAASALGAVLTSLCAGALSKRAGVVFAMTSFHIPAQFMTAAMAIAPNIETGSALYIARTCFSSLDSSVRGAFLSAMVPATSRTRFLAVNDVCRQLAAGLGPFVTGRLVKIDRLPLAFVISGAIKILADIGLLLGFSATKFEH